MSEIQFTPFTELQSNEFDFKAAKIFQDTALALLTKDNSFEISKDSSKISSQDLKNFQVMQKAMKINEVSRIYLQSLTSNNTIAESGVANAGKLQNHPEIKNNLQRERFNEFERLQAQLTYFGLCILQSVMWINQPTGEKQEDRQKEKNISPSNIEISDGVDFVKQILNDLMSLNAKILDYKYKSDLSANVLEYQKSQQLLEQNELFGSSKQKMLQKAQKENLKEIKTAQKNTKREKKTKI